MGKADARHDYFWLVGDLTQDIFDISIFVFGFDAESEMPFVTRKRVGPDALPVEAKRKMRKTRMNSDNLTLDSTDDSSESSLSLSLRRKIFQLVS